jgi:hypothetical protein
LERPLAVERWLVEGAVARLAKRPELRPFLLRARDAGGTTAEDSAEHLFGEASARRGVAQRILQIAARLGLLVEDAGRFSLSTEGDEALRRGEIFVPERGAWDVWITMDPLVPTGVLHIEPWTYEATAFDEVRGDDRDAMNSRRFSFLPGRLLSARGSELESVAGGGRMRIEELEAKGERMDAQSDVRVRWDVASHRVHIDGEVGERHVSMTLESPDHSPGSVWNELLDAADLRPDWDLARGALRVGFAGTQLRERQTMARDVTFVSPELVDFGSFDDLTVRGVPLAAKTQRDAEEWARWRLDKSVTDYATAERFNRWVGEAIAPFGAFAVAMPTRGDAAREAWAARGERPTPAVWNLVAAEDWRL